MTHSNRLDIKNVTDQKPNKSDDKFDTLTLLEVNVLQILNSCFAGVMQYLRL